MSKVSHIFSDEFERTTPITLANVTLKALEAIESRGKVYTVKASPEGADVLFSTVHRDTILEFTVMGQEWLDAFAHWLHFDVFVDDNMVEFVALRSPEMEDDGESPKLPQRAWQIIREFAGDQEIFHVIPTKL